MNGKKVYLDVRNLDFGPGFGGLTVGYFPDPRTYGLSLGVKF